MPSGVLRMVLCGFQRPASCPIWTGIPSLVLAVLALLLCLSSGELHADEVSIAYAIDSGGHQISGKLKCGRPAACHVSSDELKLTVFFILGARSQGVRVSISGNFGHPGCCYFSGGEGDKDVEVRPSVQSFGFFEGRSRKRNEYIEHTPAGTLFIAFNN